MRPRQRTRKARTFGASLCAFAGTCPAKSTDFNLFCCLRNKTPGSGFYNFLRHFILEIGFFDNLLTRKGYFRGFAPPPSSGTSTLKGHFRCAPCLRSAPCLRNCAFPLSNGGSLKTVSRREDCAVLGAGKRFRLFLG